MHGAFSTSVFIFHVRILFTNAKFFFVNWRWKFAFCVGKTYDGTHLAFGGTLDRRCHFKHISLKQSRFYHCQTSTAYR
jgi:hypothetical protein